MFDDTGNSLLTEVEAKLRERFDVDEANRTRNVPSTAKPPKTSERMDQLLLPDNMRARMPLTKDRYMIREDPALVAWEREVRKFLRNLSPQHGHRVAAVMIYEWATGMKVAELVAEGGSANRELRMINKVLRYHFDKPYMTWILGRKVKAYRVPPGWYVKRHRPMTLTLWAEYQAKTLDP